MSNRVSRRDVLAGIAAIGARAAMGHIQLANSPKEDARKEYQIGCFTRPWSDEHYLVAFDAIALAGYKHVGLMTTKLPGSYIITSQSSLEDSAKIGEEARLRGLTVSAVFGGDLRKLINNAAAVGAGTLIFGGIGRQKDYDAYYSEIGDCCAYAAEKQIELVIKPQGGLNSTGEQCKRVVEKVGDNNFRLWYDPGNIFYYSYSNGKLDPSDDALMAAGVVTGMCVKDFRPPENVDVIPGQGIVNFKRVIEELHRGGFTAGPLVIETLSPIQEAKERIAEARKVREFVNGILASLA